MQKNHQIEEFAFKGDANKVKQLVNNGTEINGKVFSEASRGKRWNIINYLSRMSKRTYKPRKIKTQRNQLLDALRFMNDRNIHNDSFLIKACEEGNFNVVKALIFLGVDLNKSGDEGHTPLMEAIMWQRTKIVKLLLEHGADKNAICVQMADDTRNADIIKLLH